VSTFQRFLGQAFGYFILAAIIVFMLEVLRFMWVAGSTPGLAGRITLHFFESAWLQSLATILIAIATIALWVATVKLSGVTAVQVHAQTAPMIAVVAYLVTDPQQPGTENSLPLPTYEFAAADDGNAEMNAFNRKFDQMKRDYDAMVQKATEQPGNPFLPVKLPPVKAYLAVRLFNTQASSSYGFATDFKEGVPISGGDG